MFSVVQYKKTKVAHPSMYVVPTSWINGDTVSYPDTEFVTFAKNANSVPDDSWSIKKCKVVGSANSYEHAEKLMSELENSTDSDERMAFSRSTRQTPGIRQATFSSQQYTLTSPSETIPVSK